MFDYQQISETELTCFHESAHAVLIFLLGYKITSIEINQDENSGTCWWDFRHNVRPAIPELQNIPEIEKHIMVDCAGYASKTIITNSEPRWHWSTDYVSAERELTPIFEKKIIRRYIESVMAWVIELLKRYWHVVELLANRLMWYAERKRFEDYPGSHFEDLLPSDYFEEPESWEMDGEEAERIIKWGLGLGPLATTGIHYR